MNSIDDWRYVAFNVAIGCAAALAHAPLVVVILLCSLVGILITPYFILSATVPLSQSLRAGHVETVLAILRDRSNIPAFKARITMAALMVAACTFGLFGQIFTEIFLPRLTGITLADRNGLFTAVLGLGLYTLYRVLIWYGRSKR